MENGTKKILSFIIYSDFGFFKKPDVNIDYLTYEYIPKPVILGILGAICGLKGYAQDKSLPEYYSKLKDTKIGVQPLKINESSLPFTPEDFEPLNKSFLKTFVKYNNYHGYGSMEGDGNWILNEQILIKPAFRIFLMRNGADQKTFQNLRNNLQNNISIYTPYMGKNDFPLSYIYEGEYEYKEGSYGATEISSIFFKDAISSDSAPPFGEGDFFMIHHSYPYSMYKQQYIYRDVLYSNSKFNFDKNKISELGCYLCEIDGKNIFLF